MGHHTEARATAKVPTSCTQGDSGACARMCSGSAHAASDDAQCSAAFVPGGSTFLRLPSTQSRLRSAPSFPIGTTWTVRDREPSAFGPSVISTILPAVFGRRCRKTGATKSCTT